MPMRRRVTSWRAFRWFEGFPEVAQQALDGVSLDDEGAQFESAVVLRPLLGVAALIALLDVDLERAAHELRVRAISGAMCWWLFAVRMRRVRLDLGWRWWHHQGAQLRCRTEYTARSSKGNVMTNCRNGTIGRTCSTRFAAV